MAGFAAKTRSSESRVSGIVPRSHRSGRGRQFVLGPQTRKGKPLRRCGKYCCATIRLGVSGWGSLGDDELSHRGSHEPHDDNAGSNEATPPIDSGTASGSARSADVSARVARGHARLGRIRRQRHVVGGTQSFSTTGLLNLHENYATVRVDHHFSDKDTLSGSWMFDRGPYTQPDPLLNVTSSLLSYSTRHTAMANS